MPELQHHLLCPIQCCVNGVQVNNCPHIYCNNPTEESNAIVTQDECGEDDIFPFFLSGVTSHLNAEPLSPNKFEIHCCPQITLTNANITWDPNNTIYEDQENATLDYTGAY